MKKNKEANKEGKQIIDLISHENGGLNHAGCVLLTDDSRSETKEHPFFTECVRLMMGKMHSGGDSAKLSFNESGDYILKHLPTAWREVSSCLTERGCLRLMCESHTLWLCDVPAAGTFTSMELLL